LRNKSHYVQTRVRLHLRQRATCTNTGPLHRSAVMSYQLHNVVRCSPTVIENAIAKVRHCESPPRDGLTKLGKSVAKASLENPRCEKHYACNNAEFNPVVIDAQFMIAAIILRDTYQCPECNAHTIMIAARMVRDNTASMIRRPMPQSQYRVSDKATDASITIQHQTNNKHGHVCASTHVHCS